MKKSLIAFAFSTLGLGIAEFVMTGILPDVTADLQISIPIAGHLVLMCLCTGCLFALAGFLLLTFFSRKYEWKQHTIFIHS